MRELANVLTTWRDGGQRRDQMLLATVVDVKGSAYRRPGARMLITAAGTRVGSVSGGCLEADVIQKGWWRTEQGRASVLLYDTKADSDVTWELGLGCNGEVRILLERMSRPGVEEMLTVLDRCERERLPAVLATVIALPERSHFHLGDRLFLTATELGGSLADSPLRSLVISLAHRALVSGTSCVVTLPESNGLEIFVEAITPALPLTVFGAGYDAVPLVQAAKQLGWHVTVADARPSYGQRHRFPLADAVVLTAPDNLLRDVPVARESVAVVMNHSYAVDREILRELLAQGVQYVGLLGPRSRADKMLTELGITHWPPCLHAPIGLDIGADTPEGIALSIVAEIQAFVAGRSAGNLRDRQAPIYSSNQPLRETDLPVTVAA